MDAEIGMLDQGTSARACLGRHGRCTSLAWLRAMRKRV